MELILYNCSDEPNKINKNISALRTINGTLKEECSEVNPNILVISDTPILGNYASIPDFGRYYFINDIVSVRNGLWLLQMHCDVLYTYRDSILALNAVIKRQQVNWNIYLDDPNFKVYNNKLVQTKLFPSGFNTEPEFILTVAGG